MLALTLLGLAALARADGSASAYSSNSDGSYKLSSIDAPVQGAGSPGSSSTWNLTVNDSSDGHKQTIVGFGAAVTDATVTSFNSLSSSDLKSLLNDLLTSSGADFALLRHTIASSDLSGDPAYTYDDNGGSADASLSSFGIGDRGTAMAKLLASMKSVKSSLKILGSSWSAPGWMKLNNNLDGSTDNNNLNDGYTGSGVGSAGYADAFAQYFVKYIQAFNDQGASIDAITIQNEPLNSQSGYPTMYVYADESAQLIQNYVGPALSKAGLSTGIWAYDHNTDNSDYPQTVINDAGEYVDTVAWHCYANPVDWSVLTTFHNKNPSVNQYMTECWTPKGTWNQAADFTIGPLQNWAQGVTAWTLGTDSNDGPHLSTGGCATCSGLVTIGSDGGYTFETSYYMIAQFSKFIPTGAIILDGSGSYTYDDGTGIQSVASLNPDGTLSVVIENLFSNDVYVTVNTNSGQEWSGNIPSESVTTWVLPASS